MCVRACVVFKCNHGINNAMTGFTLHISKIHSGNELFGCHVHQQLPDGFILDTCP